MKLEWRKSRERTAAGNYEYRLFVKLRKNWRCVATVWSNGTWHTWDENGIGGQNAECQYLNDAKSIALASAIEQGFVPNIELTQEAPDDER